MTSHHKPRYAVWLGSVAGLAAVLLAACGGADPATPASTAVATPRTSTASGTPSTTPGSTTARPSTTTAKPRAKPATTTGATAAPRTSAPAPSRTSARVAAAPKPAASANRCRVPSGVSAAQVVLVDSSGSSATIRACRRTSSGYTTDLGPYYGHVGRNGVSANKREGDLRTPAGVFPLRGGFGAYANPGLRIGSWLRVDSRDVWVDDPGSSLYNTHQRTPADGRWASAEKLLNQPAYNYAQVIGYNEGRVPGKGSAIFLHVDKGAGTAGCVSLPTRALLSVLRWERSGAVIAIR
jgi:L,D-peptidoglycan transpeptidase YkuD (ErfK/YbiS/YcfS/YnhG family)